MKPIKANVTILFYMFVAAFIIFVVTAAVNTHSFKWTFFTGLDIAVLGAIILIPSKMYSLQVDKKRETLIIKGMVRSKVIPVHSITEITLKPTYVVAQDAFMTLWVLYKSKEGHITTASINPGTFDWGELNKMIEELKSINPHIKAERLKAPTF